MLLLPETSTRRGPMKILAAAVATAALLACAKGDEANKPGADSTARNLTIAQPESGAALRDVPAKVPETTKPTPNPTKAATQVTKRVPPPPPAPVVYTAGRGVTKGDAAKVGGGAAAGAILGRILGGNSKGTVIGGIVGGAAGAAVAAGTKDADIVLPKGAHINATLTQALAVKQ